MNKLFVAFILLAFCAAVSQAGIAITTYSDSSCTNATGFSRNQEPCADKKRAVDGGNPFCYPFGDFGVYYTFDECTSEPAVTPAPSGWQRFQFDTSFNCAEDLILMAVPAPSGEKVSIVSQFLSAFFIFNTTLSCSNEGVMAISSCFQYGCLSFDSVPNGVCSNITTTFEDQQYSGIQTTCVAAPSSEPIAAPVAEPVAAPVAGPSAAPVTAPVAAPVRRSSAAASIVGFALTILAAVALLC